MAYLRWGIGSDTWYVYWSSASGKSKESQVIYIGHASGSILATFPEITKLIEALTQWKIDVEEEYNK